MTQTNFNPFIGLRTYEEADANIFRGRSTAIAELYRMIEDNDVVVLHAESGEGKSSLLNAGLFPLLREERYFPISISFTEEDFALENPDFNEIICRRIHDAVNNSQDNGSGVMVTLEPLVSSKAEVSQFTGLESNVWWLLRNYSITAFGAQLTPILVFDQFEEVFTRPEYISWTEEFFFWLATTISDNIPQEISSFIREKIGPDVEFPKIQTHKRFKALFVQRTEYMGELDYWGIQRHSISVLKNSRYCLKSLTENEADDILALQPAFTAEIREKLKNAICSTQRMGRRYSGNLPLIPAMLLSVVSTTASANLDKKEIELNEIGDRDKSKTQADIFFGIIEQFYDKEIADTRLPKKDVAIIEDVLVDENGKRVRIKADARELEAIGFKDKYKSVLEQKRLLKRTTINDAEYVELTHDAIARVVMRKRRQRIQSRANSVKLALLGGLTLLTILSLLIFFEITGIPGNSDSPFDLKTMNLIFDQSTLIKVIVCTLIYSGIAFAVYKLSKGCKAFQSICVQTVGYYLLLTTGVIVMRYFYLPSLFVSFKELLQGHEGPIVIKSFYLNLVWAGLFALGNILCRQKRLLKVLGICILCYTLLIPLYAIPLMGYIVLLGITIFGFASYTLMQERNGLWFSVMGIVTLFIAYIAFFNIFFHEMRSLKIALSFIAMTLILIVFAIYSARMPKKYSLTEAFQMIISGEVIRKNERLRMPYSVFITGILMLILFFTGVYANLGISLIIVPLLALSFYTIVKPRGLHLKKIPRIVVPCVIYISVLAMGLSYFSVWQQYIFIAILIGSFFALYFVIQDKISSGTVWSIVLFSIFGYLIVPTDNGTYLASMQSIEDVSGIRTLLVKDKKGRYGLRDLRGNMVIPCRFDTIIPYYEPGEAQGALTYMIKKDGRYTLWHPINHLLESNLLTDEYIDEYLNNKFGYTLNRVVAYDKAELQQSKLMLAAVKARDSLSFIKNAESMILANIMWELNSTKRPEDYYYRLDLSDTTVVKELSKVDFARVNIELLPYTSKNFQTKFISNIFPVLNFLGPMPVGDILESEDFKEEFTEKLEKLDFDIHTVSDQANLEDYGRYRLGELFTRLASYFLETGDYDQSMHFSEQALKYGAYSEPAIVDYMIASAIKGENDAFARIKDNPLELVRINRGPTYPNPVLDDAWMFLRYRPVYDLVETRIEQLQLPQYIDSLDLERVKEELGMISRGESFSNPYNIPYTAVQLLPDSLGGGRRYFGGLLPDISYGKSLDALREYSFFVNDSTITAGPFMCFSLPKDFNVEGVESPILVIDYLTNKRRYIKGNYSIVEAQSGAPEYLPGEYSHAWPFSEGLAAVEIDGKIGFIDETGTVVIEPQFTPNYPVGGELEKKFLDIYANPRGKRGKVLYQMPYFKNGESTVYNGRTAITIDTTGKRSLSDKN